VVAQLGHPERVGQEPGVQHVVGVGRQTVLEAEGQHGDPQPAHVFPAEQLLDPAAQLVHVQVAGVDDHIGGLAGLLQQFPLRRDAQLD